MGKPSYAVDGIVSRGNDGSTGTYYTATYGTYTGSGVPGWWVFFNRHSRQSLRELGSELKSHCLHS